jgi:hypothetical protein
MSTETTYSGILGELQKPENPTPSPPADAPVPSAG